MSHIQTYSGKAFDLLNPRAADIDWRDIVVGLARDNRFHGQTTWCEWSTAQHSWLASMYGEAENGCDREEALGLLLHDAAEAYCRDLASPLKRAMRKLQSSLVWDGNYDKPPDDPYTVIYRGVENAILTWADLMPHAFDTPTVKHVDLRMCATERELFMSRPFTSTWGDMPPPYENADTLAKPRLYALGDPTRPETEFRGNRRAQMWTPWYPKVAAIRFTERLGELAPHLITGTDDVFPWDTRPSWVVD